MQVNLRGAHPAAEWLQHLDLSRNEAADHAGVQAGVMLAEGRVRLQSLDLGWNLIRNEAAVALFEGLRSNRCLRFVDLSGSAGIIHLLYHTQAN